MHFESELEEGTPRPPRRLRQRLSRQPAAHLNIVSLIDVFAVLVFFLLSDASITATKLQALELKMAAPVAQQTPADGEEGITLRLSEHGLSVHFRGSQKSFPGWVEGEAPAPLIRYLEQIKIQHPQMGRAVLEVEDRVNYAAIVGLMALLNRGGPTQPELFPDISLSDISSPDIATAPALRGAK